jgi:hypothetical protein
VQNYTLAYLGKPSSPILSLDHILKVWCATSEGRLTCRYTTSGVESAASPTNSKPILLFISAHRRSSALPFVFVGWNTGHIGRECPNAGVLEKKLAFINRGEKLTQLSTNHYTRHNCLERQTPLSHKEKITAPVISDEEVLFKRCQRSSISRSSYINIY